MSLTKQLWLAISLVMALAFGCSLLVSVLSARHYLEQQLQVKNIDNATSLALALTQMAKDPVTVELQISAQFDAGHYQFIRVASPNGQLLAERVSKSTAQGAPAWFVSLIPINAKPGKAQVLDGWKQFGTLSLASHDQYAYQTLWDGTVELFLWFLAGSLVIGLAGTLAVRAITRPLKDVVGQAKAIAARRFVSVPLPRTPEMRAMAGALNEMVERLKSMFAEEAERLEALRRQANYDAVTGLADREYFMAGLREQLSGEQHASSGALVIVEIADLAELNARLGHRQIDQALTQFGQVLNAVYADRDSAAVGRLRGSDFAVLCPGEDSPSKAASQVHAKLSSDWLPLLMSQKPDLFHVGAVPYRQGETVSDLMVRAEQALALAKGKGPNSWHALQTTNPGLSMGADQWRALFDTAIRGDLFSLATFAVRDGAGKALLHNEAVLRLRRAPEQPPVSAGEFMPMAAHLGMTAPIDLAVVGLALG
ncbi:MAG: LapD/MoxY N-terminal periplasmic domain-containing protein, partial [Quisquiliibacterium sp.]